MTEPVHQTWFECENCGSEGYVQSVMEPNFCPICGDETEHDLIEFTLVEGDLPVKEIVKTKIVYRNNPTEPRASPVLNPETDKRFTYKGNVGPRGLGQGIRPDPNHKIVNRPPKISSIKRDHERRQYTVDCGYKGLRASIVSHLVTWHGMTLEEAKEATKIANHDAVDITTTPPVCENIGLYPLTAEVKGHIIDESEERRYRFKLSCGYCGPRSSTLKHLCVHHGYSRKDARALINLRDGNVDLTNMDVLLDEAVAEV